MAAVNYYLGLKRGASANEGNVIPGLSSGGTAADVEVRIQINDGSNATNITKLDVDLLLETIERYIASNGIQVPPAGTDLPPL